MIRGIDSFTANEKRKDNIIGYLLVAIGAIGLLLLGAAVVAKDFLSYKIPVTSLNLFLGGVLALVLLIAGLYLIPNILRKYKAGVTALIATLASGFTFVGVAAFVIIMLPTYLNQAAPSLAKGVPPVDVFILPIVIGCAAVNFVIAQVLYGPAKKSIR
jgi:hypothetical protein